MDPGRGQVRGQGYTVSPPPQQVARAFLAPPAGQVAHGLLSRSPGTSDWACAVQPPSSSMPRGTGCSLLQGILPTQKTNPSFLHCRQILYQLSYEGSLWTVTEEQKNSWKRNNNNKIKLIKYRFYLDFPSFCTNDIFMLQDTIQVTIC